MVHRYLMAFRTSWYREVRVLGGDNTHVKHLKVAMKREGDQLFTATSFLRLIASSLLPQRSDPLQTSV